MTPPPPPTTVKKVAAIPSGWCLTGHCLPSPTTSGCPGTFEAIGDCPCTCHQGEVPQRALRQHEFDVERTSSAKNPDDEEGVAP